MERTSNGWSTSAMNNTASRQAPAPMSVPDPTTRTSTMKVFAVALATASLMLAGCAHTDRTPHSPPVAPTLEELRAVSPGLERYTTDTLLGDLWKRPDLSPRDRSIVTVSRADRTQPGDRTALPSQPGAGQRCHACGALRAHHPPGVLLRLGQCHGGGSRREGRVRTARDRRRPVAAGFRRPPAAGRSHGGSA